MRPVVDGLQREYGERVAFAGVDYYNPSNRELSARYKVFGHPTFVVLNPEGEVVSQFTGFVEESELDAALQRAAPPG
jgi:thiol:disulfide interchange protein